MPIDKIERNTRALVDQIRSRLDVATVTDAEAIRGAALAQFSRELELKLRNLQDGETLQVTFRIDIVGQNDAVRGGIGSDRTMPEYAAWRDLVFVRDNYTCRECGAKGDVQAHHIKPWSTHPDYRFDIENGLTLCVLCHAAKHPHLRMMSSG